MRSPDRWTTVAATVVVAAALTACSAAADRSGGPSRPRTLVLASNDGDGLSGAPAVARFVDRVRADSGGRLLIRVAPNRAGAADEPKVVRDVAAGRADLGWSGTRALDLVGVRTFQPLHAPFLVGSHAAEAAVVQDAVAGRMLAGLRPLGLTGLALLADELRVPAAAAGPLLTPADFRGLLFGSPASRVQAAGVSALGARPRPLDVNRSPAIDDLDALDTMWWTYQANGQFARMRFVTADAALWPRTTVVFAGTRGLAGLSRQEQGWLHRAAAEATAWSAVHAGDAEATQVAQACRAGARLAVAGPTRLAAMRAAAEPVYRTLRADPATAPILARIEQLAGGTAPQAPPIPDGCAYRPGDEARLAPAVAALTGPGHQDGLPAGVYRYALTREWLAARGHDPHDVDINAGVFTWTLRGGSWSYSWNPATPGVSGPGAYTACAGWYDARGSLVSFTTRTRHRDGDCAPPTWSARWTLDGTGLQWSRVSAPDYVDYVSQPWQRIG